MSSGVRPPCVLSIAGSDPSGGAGIQADLKTMSALGAYGMAAVTALTAQNTCGVSAVHQLPGRFIRAQIDAIFEDIEVDAVKVGMLGDVESILAVAAALEFWQPRFVVLDPVMIAKSGSPLLAPTAVLVVREALLPLATVVTPNVPEAAALLDGAAPTTVEELLDAARALRQYGPRCVVLKGGHLEDAGASTDVVVGPEGELVLPASRLPTRNTHGTGCTLSAAIAALLPRRARELDAIREAKTYVWQAIAHSGELHVGRGQGPVHHFHAWWHPQEDEA